MRRGAQYPDTQNTQVILLWAIAEMQGIFSTEDNFCVISDWSNSFNCTPKKPINEQIIIFYSPPNALCSSDESVQIKNLNIILSLVCVPFSLGSICKYWISANEDISSLKQME